MTNLPFDLQNDKGGRDDRLFQTYQIVSLQEVLQFNAALFMKISSSFAETSKIISQILKKNPNDNRINSILLSRFKGTMEWIYNNLAEMHLNLSAKTAKKLLNTLNQDNSDISISEFRSLLDQLGERITDELEDRLLLIVGTDRAAFYHVQGTILGEKTIKKLRFLEEDAAEAGNCFALGRYTACVFHLMRIMERVVQQFGKKVRVPLNVKNESWDKIAKQIKKLTEPEPTDDLKQKKKKKRYQVFYDRLDAVRVAWRNPTMHPKVTYTEEEAKEVMDAVRLFVKDFATLR